MASQNARVSLKFVTSLHKSVANFFGKIEKGMERRKGKFRLRCVATGLAQQDTTTATTQLRLH